MRTRFSRALHPIVAPFALSFCLLAAVPVSAADFTFNGTFTQDNELADFLFTITGADTNVTLETTSYNAGGFDTVLSLFDQGGSLIDFNDDGPAPGDSQLQLTLQPGTYTLILTQFDNFANGPTLADGFIRDGDPNFTQAFAPPSTPGFFFDSSGVQRTGNYALNINNVTNAISAPEPGTVTLLLCGFLLAGRGLRRRN